MDIGVIPELIVTLIAILYVVAIQQWSRLNVSARSAVRRNELLFIVLGILLAPLVTGVLFGMGIYLQSIVNHTPNFGVAAIFVTVAYEFALAAAMVGGFPAHFILKHRGMAGVWGYAIAGAIIGLLTGGILMMTELFSLPAQHEAWRIAMRLVAFAAMGAASGATFWIIARPRPGAPDNA